MMVGREMRKVFGGRFKTYGNFEISVCQLRLKAHERRFIPGKLGESILFKDIKFATRDIDKISQVHSCI